MTARGHDQDGFSWTTGGSETPGLGAPELTLTVDTAIYGLQALRRACYALSGRCSFLAARVAGSRCVAVAFHPRRTNGDLKALIQDFLDELLDQQVRQDLARESGLLRDLIVAQAFAEGNLLSEGPEGDDYRADPLGAGQRRTP